VPDPGEELDLLLYGPMSTFDPSQSCQQWGDSVLLLSDPAPGTSFAVVDGRGDTFKKNAGPFSIQLTCDYFQLDCSAPQGTLQCGQTTSDSFPRSRGIVQGYPCASGSFPAPESVYRFHNDVKRTVSIRLTS